MQYKINIFSLNLPEIDIFRPRLMYKIPLSTSLNEIDWMHIYWFF